ncbi:MAG: hypothetical protein PVI26_03830 [Chitinispirillia bacterium]
MNRISTDITNQSIQAINQILENAQQKNLVLAQKLLQVNTEMKLGTESGKGELLDVVA